MGVCFSVSLCVRCACIIFLLLFSQKRHSGGKDRKEAIRQRIMSDFLLFFFLFLCHLLPARQPRSVCFPVFDFDKQTPICLVSSPARYQPFSIMDFRLLLLLNLPLQTLFLFVIPHQRMTFRVCCSDSLSAHAKDARAPPPGAVCSKSSSQNSKNTDRK